MVPNYTVNSLIIRHSDSRLELNYDAGVGLRRNDALLVGERENIAFIVEKFVFCGSLTLVLNSQKVTLLGPQPRLPEVHRLG